MKFILMTFILMMPIVGFLFQTSFCGCFTWCVFFLIERARRLKSFLVVVRVVLGTTLCMRPIMGVEKTFCVSHANTDSPG